jgi:hypothetical protein
MQIGFFFGQQHKKRISFLFFCFSLLLKERERERESNLIQFFFFHNTAILLLFQVRFFVQLNHQGFIRFFNSK